MRDGGRIAATMIIIGGRRKQLEMMGVYENSFLDSGRRNNGLGPFCLDLWREQSWGVEGGNMWPFPLDWLRPAKE